jgi:hypothetical protein
MAQLLARQARHALQQLGFVDIAIQQRERGAGGLFFAIRVIYQQ